MDSKIVNRVIRSQIRPFLKENGFQVFTARSGWRHELDRIDVVNFQSFNSYLARSVGCTTYSFAVNLGIYFPVIPRALSPVKEKNGRLLPEEYKCHLRKSLQKNIVQPEFPRSDIWFIDPNGEYLEPAIDDARSVIAHAAFPWFERFSDISEALRTLLEDEEDLDGGTWGFGTKSSPVRNYSIGYIALALGRYSLAAEALGAALASGCYDHTITQVKADIERAAGGTS